MFSCNLPPALLAEWPGFFTCYCGNTGVERILKIRVSTESRPWRRKFSRRSSRDSNPIPFNHKSGALTTELSPPPSLNGLEANKVNSVTKLHGLRRKAEFCFIGASGWELAAAVLPLGVMPVYCKLIPPPPPISPDVSVLIYSCTNWLIKTRQDP